MISRLFLALVLLGSVIGSEAQAMTISEVTNLHHRLTVSIDPASATISATDEITFNGGGTVGFQLNPDFEISKLALDGYDVTPSEWNNGHLTIGRQARHSISVAYVGKLAPIPNSRGGRPPRMGVAGKAGVFLPSGALWYPRLSAHQFTYELSLWVPAPYKAVAPGKILTETPSTDGYHATFKTERPTDEIVAFVAPYNISETRRNGVRVRTYFTPMLKGMAADYLELSAQYIEHYSQLIGPYPFADFHIIAAPIGVGLGYRNLTYMSERVLRLPFIRYTSLPHEILHNWWGNGVQPNYGLGNWAEGLTTYMADYAMSARRGPAKAREKRIGWLRDYAALDPSRDAPVARFTGKTHTAAQVIGYNKVAYIFHMLRARIGDDAFDAGLKSIWAEKAFSIASWRDLQTAFEAASGADLTPFFAQWIARTGAPKLRLVRASQGPAENGTEVTVTLGQDDPTYDLMIPIAIETESGTERFNLPMNKREVTKQFIVKSKPTAISVDSDFDLFRRLSLDETPPILRDVTLASQAQVLVLGAAKTGRQLATRMLDQPPRFVSGQSEIKSDTPLLIIGVGDAVNSVITSLDLRPADQFAPTATGTARVWSHRDANGRAVVVVAAADEPSLAKLLRPLPHYGRYSYLVFNGARAVAKGTWELKSGPLTHRFN